MKRLALAVAGGFVIPFLYAIVAAPLSSYITNPTLDRLLMFPVRWPILILFQLHFLPFENEIAILVYIVVCNVILYSILGYVLLLGLTRRKKAALLSPPEPPSFVQN